MHLIQNSLGGIEEIQIEDDGHVLQAKEENGDISESADA